MDVRHWKRISVNWSVLVDIGSSREVFGVTTNVDGVLRLVNTNPVYPHCSWENQVRSVDYCEVWRDAQVSDEILPMT